MLCIVNDVMLPFIFRVYTYSVCECIGKGSFAIVSSSKDQNRKVTSHSLFRWCTWLAARYASAVSVCGEMIIYEFLHLCFFRTSIVYVWPFAFVRALNVGFGDLVVNIWWRKSKFSVFGSRFPPRQAIFLLSWQNHDKLVRISGQGMGYARCSKSGSFGYFGTVVVHLLT